jgi:hypothetical protein
MIGFILTGAAITVMGGVTVFVFTRPVFFKAKRLRSPPFYRPKLAPTLETVKCPHCSGGTQWLHPVTGWGKIPKHMLYRRWNSADQDYDCGEPIHANLRSCPECAGWGGIYRHKDQGEKAS